MSHPIDDAQKRIEVANAEQSALRRLDAPRGTFDAEYDILVRDALPATGGRLIPRETVRRVFNSMRRLNARDWGYEDLYLPTVKENEFWVSYAYRIADVATETKP